MQQDGYFVRIHIIKLNKHLDFPLASKLNEESGVRDFINDMDNGIIYIDKVGLEELITYHEAEFEIIDGYYYNEGRTNTINHVMEDLYNLRNNMKKNKNAQIVIKLLMNSMYGKTIIKPLETYTIVKDKRQYFEKHISYNYNYIDSVIEVNGKFYINKLNQYYHILIMSVVVLKSCLCQNELCTRCLVVPMVAMLKLIINIQIQFI